MFFKILSAADASPQPLDRQRAIVRPAELSENDFCELKTVMESFGLSLTANISDIQLEEKRVGGPDKKVLEGLTHDQWNPEVYDWTYPPGGGNVRSPGRAPVPGDIPPGY